MRTLNEEIARIKSEVADIAIKTFSGKSVQQRVNQYFAEITWQEYEAAEKVWDELYHRRRELREELYHINDQIAVVEKIICQPIKQAFEGAELINPIPLNSISPYLFLSGGKPHLRMRFFVILPIDKIPKVW